MQANRWTRIGAVTTAGALTLGACGGSGTKTGSPAATSPAATSPVTARRTITGKTKVTTTVPTVRPSSTTPSTTTPSTTVPSTTVPSTTSAPASAPPAPTATTATDRSPTTPVTPGAAFAAALSQWQQGAQQASATQHQYFLEAANDLNTQASGPGFSNAVAELQNLAFIPATNATSAQTAQAQSDVAALDQFFHTPGLYG